MTPKFPQTGLYPGIDEATYFGINGGRDLADFILSKSLLQDFMKSPYRWRNQKEGKDSAALRFGNLIDCGLLTPEEMHKRFKVMPATYNAYTKGKDEPEVKPFNINSHTCKQIILGDAMEHCKGDEWKKWDKAKLIEFAERHGGITYVMAEQWNEAHEAIKSLRENEIVTEILHGAQTQVGMVGQLGKNLLKGLIDILPAREGKFGKAIFDLKTRGQMDTPLDIQKAIFNFGYHKQAALYLDLYNFIAFTDWIRESGVDISAHNGGYTVADNLFSGHGTTPEDAVAAFCEEAEEPGPDIREEFWFAFEQSSHPWEVVVAPLAKSAIEMGRAEYMEAIELWNRCVETNDWPSRFEDVTEFDLPYWAYKQQN